jgi:hypothetical protein
MRSSTPEVPASEKHIKESDHVYNFFQLVVFQFLIGSLDVHYVTSLYLLTTVSRQTLLHDVDKIGNACIEVT